MPTDASLSFRLQFWQKKLSLLGISHFRIDKCEIVDECEGGYDAAASVSTSGKYDRFTVQFRRDEIETYSDAEIDEVIIHELLHVAMRDYDTAVEYVDSYELGQATFQAWSKRVLHEREGLVDRLAKQIYALYSGSC